MVRQVTGIKIKIHLMISSLLTKSIALISVLALRSSLIVISLLAMSSKRTLTIFESSVTSFSIDVTSFFITCGSAFSLGMFSFFLGTGAQPINYHYNAHCEVFKQSIKSINQVLPSSSFFQTYLGSFFRFYCFYIFEQEYQKSGKQYLFDKMGSQICRREEHEAQFSTNPFEYIFEEDNRELRITHDDHIECTSPQIEKILTDCENKLKKSQKLFKDISMKTDAIVLKSLTGTDTQVKCSFERPYVFLSDSTAGRGKSYKILNRIDSKSSQIIIRDEALQYFGVFLCYLADNPTLITEILLTKQNTYGIHCLKMNVNSQQQYVYIDDYILCLDRLPLFAQPVKGQYMWTCLLEKAWLKINGNITKAIHKIDPYEVFKTFLSYPMRNYLMLEKQNKNEDDGKINAQNIKLLQSNLHNLQANKGCIITTKKSPKHKIGISGRKNFYLIKCFDFQGHHLYYLRNPCSKGLDFRGKRSEMTKELIDRLCYMTKEERIPEGNFVLEEDEMLEQVESFLIIHYEPNSSVISELSLALQEEKESFVEFSMPHDGFVSLCLHQQLPSDAEKVYSPLSHLVISQSQERVISDLQNTEGCFGVANTYLLQNLYGELKSGKYLIRLKKKRNSKALIIAKRSDKLVVTAPFAVDFSIKDQPLLRARFESFLKGEGRSKISAKKIEKQALKQDCCQVGFWLGDLAVIYLQKIAKSKKEAKVEGEFLDLKNLKCTSDSIQNGFIVVDHIEDERLIIFEKIDLAGETRLGRYVIQSF